MTPVVITNPDGRLEVFARGEDFNAYHIWQNSPGGGWAGWSPICPIGKGCRTSAGNDLAITLNQDGRPEMFALNGAGACYHTWRDAAGDWVLPQSLGSPYIENTYLSLNAITASRHLDGRLQVFGRAGDIVAYNSGSPLNTASKHGAAFVTRQESPGSSSWTGWIDLSNGFIYGAPMTEAGGDQVAAIIYAGAPGSLQGWPALLVSEPDAASHAVWMHMGQRVPVMGDSDQPLVVYASCAVATSGKTTWGFFTDNSGHLNSSYFADSTWYGWDSSSDVFLLGPPIAVTRGDGTIDVLGRGGKNRNLWHKRINGTPNPGFSAQIHLEDTQMGLGAGNPAIGLNQDGRLEAFAVNVSGNLWHTWEASAGAGWVSGSNLGHPGGSKLLTDDPPGYQPASPILHQASDDEAPAESRT